ncbi:MAG: diguanylate cyclase [Fervidobacterium sp.]|nr:diguanylate cyclase [Fervidobacterium sp.]
MKSTKLTKATDILISYQSIIYLSFLAIFLVLYDVSLYNYLFYHTTIEFFSIFVGLSISLISLVTMNISKNKIFTLVGIIYLFTSIVDYVHTLAYKGMNIFIGWTANQPTQLWILGRLIQAFGTFIIFYIEPERLKNKVLFTSFSLITFAGIISITYGYFPDCYVEGKGLTKFKILMEYVVVILSALTIFRIKAHEKQEPEDDSCFCKEIKMSLYFLIASELSFTLYTDVYGFFNFVGHVFKFFSYYVLLRGIVVRSLQNPVRTILADLNSKEKELEKIAYFDRLTGLYSRNFYEELIKKHLSILDRNHQPSGLILIDINNFKTINDTYGHTVGDEVLRFLGHSILKNIRAADIAARYGGDEFIIILPNSKAYDSTIVAERIKNYVITEKPFKFSLDISYGIGEFHNSNEYQEAFKSADMLLYEMKKHKNNKNEI